MTQELDAAAFRAAINTIKGILSKEFIHNVSHKVADAALNTMTDICTRSFINPNVIDEIHEYINDLRENFQKYVKLSRSPLGERYKTICKEKLDGIDKLYASRNTTDRRRPTSFREKENRYRSSTSQSGSSLIHGDRESDEDSSSNSEELNGPVKTFPQRYNDYPSIIINGEDTTHTDNESRLEAKWLDTERKLEKKNRKVADQKHEITRLRQELDNSATINHELNRVSEQYEKCEQTLKELHSDLIEMLTNLHHVQKQEFTELENKLVNVIDSVLDNRNKALQEEIETSMGRQQIAIDSLNNEVQSLNITKEDLRVKDAEIEDLKETMQKCSSCSSKITARKEANEPKEVHAGVLPINKTLVLDST